MSAKQYVDLGGITVYDEEIKNYIENNEAKLIPLSASEYEALPESAKEDPLKLYFVYDQDIPGVGEFDDLTDVDITSPQNGQVPIYNSTTQKWENGNPSAVITEFEELDDVAISSPQNGQVATYNSTTQKWENADPQSVPSDLDDLENVSISSPSNGQGLIYNSTSQEWENANLPESGVDELSELTDVSLSSPTSGQVLTYNGSAWENQSPQSTVSDLDDLDDVDITTPTSGQYLKYNGTGWVNEEGGDDPIIYLTKSQYDSITPETDQMYGITDFSPIELEVIDDSTVAINKAWSGSKVNNMLKVTSIAVDLTNWTEDTTSQSGTTLYKKQISLTNVYVSSPSVDISCASGSTLPTTAEQESYNLLQYVTVDSAVPCLYLYASEIPTTAFYIKVTGVE